MNPLLRESAAHVFVDSVESPALSADDAHHLGRVLRIRPTDTITVCDGDSRWATARFAGEVVERTGDMIVEPSPSSGRGVVCATPKGDRPELIVQKLTELGIDRIGFMEIARSVVRWDARKATAQLERLRRIAREAAMQSRRVRLPEVCVVSFADVVAESGVALAEPGGVDPWTGLRTVVIGPEGGFTAEELAAGGRRVSLGDTVLRVETAAISAGVLLMHSS